MGQDGVSYLEEELGHDGVDTSHVGRVAHQPNRLPLPYLDDAAKHVVVVIATLEGRNRHHLATEHI